MSDDEDVGNIADKLLTFLHLCEEKKPQWCSVPLQSMDGATPMLHDVRSPDAEEVLIPRNTGQPAVWPLDVSVCMDMTGRFDPPDNWPDGTIQFHRARTITTAEARKMGATVFSPKMVHHSGISAMPDGTAISGGGPYALLGGKWKPAATSRIVYPPDEGALPIHIGWALMQRYEWSVWLGYASGPRIRFLSDPAGAREAFRLRDIPPGRARRAALRNWVSGHWRCRRGDEGHKAWIAEHLRGATDFTWNGLRCRIDPPAFDVERLAKQA